MRQHGAPLAEPLQRARTGWAGGGCAHRTAADLFGRAAQRRHHRRPDPPVRAGPAVCVWTLDRLVAYLSEQGIAMRRSRISEIFIREGLRGARTKPGSGAGRSRLRAKKGGDRAALHGAAGGQRSRLPGRDGTAGRPRAIQAGSSSGRRRPKAEPARQEIDYGRRGVAGYVFGAFQPASGEAFTQPYERRTRTNWVDFLSEVEAWIDPASRAGLCGRRQPQHPQRAGRAAVQPAPSALGVRLPAQVRGLPEPDRAVVEGAALAWL